MKDEKTTPSEYKGPDRRKYLRFGYPFFIRVTKDGEANIAEKPSLMSFKELQDNHISISRDISIGGIRFVTSRDYLPGSLVNVEVFSPTRKTPFNILGKVVWRKKRILGSSSGGTYEMGIEFLKIEGENEFKNLLEQLVKTKLEKVLL